MYGINFSDILFVHIGLVHQRLQTLSQTVSTESAISPFT